MLDEYLSLGGVELGNNARAYDYARCMCCNGALKLPGCEGIHDATNDYTPAVIEPRQRENHLTNPRMDNSTATWSVSGSGVTQTPQVGQTLLGFANASASIAPALTSELVASVPGEPWYGSIGVEVPIGEPTMFVQWGVYSYSDPSTPDGTFAVSDLVEVGAGERARLTTPPIVLPAGSVGVRLRLDVVDVVAGASLQVRRAIAENSDEPGQYFDGTNLPADADPETDTVEWTGAVDASTSLYNFLFTVTPAQSLGLPYTCENISDAPWYDPSNQFSAQLSGFYLLDVKGATDGTMTAGITEGLDDGGVIGAAREATRSVRVRSMIVGCGRAAVEYGLAWLKAAVRTPFCARHGDGCGTSDLAFFIDCPPPLESDSTTYTEDVAKYRRYLHGVGCTSAPIVSEEYALTGGGYVMVVEYILTAESPFVWGETIPVQSTGTVLTAFDDIPFNLMRYPSGEEGNGVPAVVATQYAFNGSAEYGGSSSTLPTGWAHAETNIAAGITVAKSSDIAAVGANSARSRLLATGTISGGEMSLSYDVALGSLPGGSRPSLSVWAAVIVFAGTPIIDYLDAEVEWRDGGGALSTDALGIIPLAGGNAIVTGMTVPVGAVTARLRITAHGIEAVSGNDVRLYGDAFALTVP